MHVTVTQEHLDKAIAAVAKPDFEVTTSCVLAQAIGDAFPYFISCGTTTAWFRHSAAWLDPTGRMITRLFDLRDYNQIRSMLPCEVELIPA